MALPIQFAACSDVGRERDENQDAWGRHVADDLDVFIVCDGLGGYRGGATASRTAVAAIEERIGREQGSVPARLERSVQRANRLVHEAAQSDRELHKMATTAVLVAVDLAEGVAHLAHVGDSRAYLVRGDEIRQLTRDHTVVQRLVDEGVLDAEAAANHPHGNVISRSVGGESFVEIEHSVAPITLEDGDIFVLCSDGLHGLVGAPEIARTVRTMPPEEAAQRLVDRANEEGGHDNITVEVALLGEMPATSPETFSVVVPAALRRRPTGPEELLEATTDDQAYDEPHDDADLEADETAPLSLQPPMDEEAPTEPAMSAEPRPDDGTRGRVVLTAVLAGLVVVAVGIAVMLAMDTERREHPPTPVQDLIDEAEGSG